MKFISHSENETKKIGRKIASGLKGGEVLALLGDLGAGKTVLAKSIAEGLGYKGIINSPTFVLMKVYRIKIGKPVFGLSKDSSQYLQKIPPSPPLKKWGIVRNICHIDTYRISSADEIEDIGALEYFSDPKSVSIVEWPEKIKKILPCDTIWVELGYGKNESERIITINLKRRS